MKLFKASLFFVLVLAVSLPVQAQLQANIPFNFVVAGKSLPAGHYRVTRVSFYDEVAWFISNQHGGVIVHTATAESKNIKHRPSLIFLAADGTYSLARFWSGEDRGRELTLRPKVKTTIVAEGAKYVEIGAE
jgi:hypothetical protein